MDVGDFLQLERAFERDREVVEPAQEKEILGAGVFQRDRFDRFIAREDRFHLRRDRLERADDLCAAAGREHADSAHEQRHERQHRDLGGERLGRGHADFRSGVQINSAIRLARNRAADDVAEGEHLVAPPAGLPQAGECVGRFARLRDDEDQRVLVDRRVAIAEFAGVFHLDRDVSEFLEEVLSDQRGVPTRAARGHDNPVHRPQFRQGHVQAAKFCRGLFRVQTAPHRVFDRAGLLEDLLEHVMRELASFGRLRTEFDLADLDGRGVRAKVFHLELFRRQGNHIVVVQINHLACVGNDGARVTGQKIFARTDPDEQGRPASRAHDEVRAVGANDGDSVCANDFFERLHDGSSERRKAVGIGASTGRLQPGVVFADQMGAGVNAGGGESCRSQSEGGRRR